MSDHSHHHHHHDHDDSGPDTRSFQVRTLDNIMWAAERDALASVTCKDRKTGAEVNVLVALEYDNPDDPKSGGAKVHPLARLFDSKDVPFDELEPPEGLEVVDRRKPLQ